MKVNYEKVVRACNALDKLRDEKMSNDSARKLFALKKTLDEPFEFYSEREAKLCQQSGGQMQGNTIVFAKNMEEQRIAFVNGLKELNEMTTELEWNPCVITDDIQISWGIAYDLSDFISFDRKEN